MITLNHAPEALAWLRKLGHTLFPTDRDLEEHWLAESVDRVDLENRMNQLAHGSRAPHGWIETHH